MRALPSVTRDPPRSRLEEGWVDMISETIAKVESSPTGLSREDAAALAETFRQVYLPLLTFYLPLSTDICGQALLRIHLSDSFMRDLWIRLHVHALLRGSRIFDGVELFPDAKPSTAKPPTPATSIGTEPSTTGWSISAGSSTTVGSSTLVETATIAESPTNAKSPTNTEPSTNVGSPTSPGPPADIKPFTEPPKFEPSGFVDVWGGSYHGNLVCIKAIRTRNKSNLQKIKKVHN